VDRVARRDRGRPSGTEISRTAIAGLPAGGLRSCLWCTSAQGGSGSGSLPRPEILRSVIGGGDETPAGPSEVCGWNQNRSRLQLQPPLDTPLPPRILAPLRGWACHRHLAGAGSMMWVVGLGRAIWRPTDGRATLPVLRDYLGSALAASVPFSRLPAEVQVVWEMPDALEREPRAV